MFGKRKTTSSKSEDFTGSEDIEKAESDTSVINTDDKTTRPTETTEDTETGAEMVSVTYTKEELGERINEIQNSPEFQAFVIGYNKYNELQRLSKLLEGA